MRFPVLPALIVGLAVLLVAGRAADAPVAAADTKLFEYDHKAPPNLREIGTETRDHAVIREVTFAGAKSPVSAYLVGPEKPAPSLAGILYVHWLGDPQTTNRTEFLNEAVALANEGMVSLLVDAMWAEPKWYRNRIPEQDYEHSIEQVIALRRAMDVLVAQPGVDPKRIAYVGHDFGAMYGVVAGAVDHRATTYVLMTGTPHFADWYLFARQPQSPEAYRSQMAPLDPINFVSRLAPAPVFFQFASNDEYVSAEAAIRFYAAALPRKHMALYSAGHDLHTPEATADRVTWLIRQLGAK